jgi:hypothetical protein
MWSSSQAATFAYGKARSLPGCDQHFTLQVLSSVIGDAG